MGQIEWNKILTLVCGRSNIQHFPNIIKNNNKVDRTKSNFVKNENKLEKTSIAMRRSQMVMSPCWRCLCVWTQKKRFEITDKGMSFNFVRWGSDNELKNQAWWGGRHDTIRYKHTSHTQDSHGKTKASINTVIHTHTSKNKQLWALDLSPGLADSGSAAGETDE